MSMAFGVKILSNQFAAIATGIENDVTEIVRETAKMIESEARELAPVQTGSLKSTIRAEPVTPLMWIVSAGGPAPGEVNDPVEYAELVENGTTTRAATPFFTPAVDMARSWFGDRVKITVSQSPRKYASRLKI